MYRFELGDIHISDLSNAIEIAKTAHRGQVDKAGKLTFPRYNRHGRWRNSFCQLSLKLSH